MNETEKKYNKTFFSPILKPRYSVFCPVLDLSQIQIICHEKNFLEHFTKKHIQGKCTKTALTLLLQPLFVKKA